MVRYCIGHRSTKHYYIDLKRFFTIHKSFRGHELMRGQDKSGDNNSMSTSKKKGSQGRNSITDPSIAKLFERKNFAFLATLMKDGSPQVTPTWVDIDRNNSTILVNTAKGRIKYRNISRDPRIALSVIDSANPYDMVTVRGRVVEQIKGKDADEHIDKLARKYLGKEKYPRRRAGEERVLLRIKPELVARMG
jgi:PPOX class probable F420-dependent enzyme